MTRRSLTVTAAVIITAALASAVFLSSTLKDTDNRADDGRDVEGRVASDKRNDGSLAASKDPIGAEVSSLSGDDEAFKRLMSRMGASDGEKGRQFWINAMQDSGMTAEEIEEQLRLYEEFTDPDEEHEEEYAELHEQLENTVGQEEADFVLALMNQGSDWQGIKDLIENRLAAGGDPVQLNDVALKLGLNSGQIGAVEIEAYIARGATLPEDAIYNLAARGAVDTILELTSRGTVRGDQYRHPLVGTNAIGALIERTTYISGDHGPDKIAQTISVLVGLGLTVTPSHGSYDPMDYALRHPRERNIDVKVAIVEELLRHGAVVTDDHKQSLQEIPDEELRGRLETALANHL